MYEDLEDVFDDLELGCATRRHLPRILNGWSAMHRTRCDCNGGACNTTYNQREPSAFVRDPLRTHKTAHRLGETSETACSRSVAREGLWAFALGIDVATSENDICLKKIIQMSRHVATFALKQ